MPLPQGFVSDQQTSLPAGFVLDQQNPTQTQKSVPFGEQVNQAISDIPRQLGLTGRHILEGVGDTADLLAAPIRAGLNAAGMNIQGRSGQTLADALGLPTPQNPTERVVGDISRVVSGSALPIGLAGKAADATTGVTQGVFKAISARPDMQLASAAGAGGAGGIVKESGGNDISQFLAALAGGMASPLALSGAQSALNAGKTVANRFINPQTPTQNIDNLIDSAVQKYGVSVGDLSDSVRNSLRNDIQNAQKTGTLTPDVVRRLADYRITGLTPTQGPLTLDPGIVTRQKNLTALGASSQDPNLQALSQIQNANAAKLVENINSLGANAPQDAVSAGRAVTDFLKQKDALTNSAIDALYQNAADAAGRGALMNGKSFASYVTSELKNQYGRNWSDVVPSWLSGRIQNLADGEPLTVKDWNTLRTLIGNDTRSATGNTKYALGFINRALENTPFINSSGEQAAQAANLARSNFKNWAQIVEETPALQAVRDGVEPDQFVKKFIIGSGDNASVDNVGKLVQLIKSSPETMTAVKNNISQTLKSAALGGKADEFSRFSSSNYNKALNAIGDSKLNMFFSPQEVQALKAIGRVSGYEQFQPTGSAVNNSNTAAATIATILDRIGNNFMARKLTLGIAPGVAKIISDPLRNAAASSEAKGLLSVPVSAFQRPANDPMFMLPPILAPYLLQND